MNPLHNIAAFVRVARLGSFTAAARELNVAASVITKRITQLEKELGTPLVSRSTRGLALTAAGERLLPRFVRLLAEYDEIFDQDPGNKRLEGNLRIKSPTSFTSIFLGKLYAEFLAHHPGVTLDIVMMDRSVNPLEENFDLAVGALPVSYPNVADVPLCQYELITCCSPAYLQRHAVPQHPTDLVDHECLTTSLFRTNWLFESSRGTIAVDVHSRLHVSDSRVLREAALHGLGVVILPRFLVELPFSAGTLVPLLQNFPVSAFWIKALVPRMKLNRPLVRELVDFLKAHTPEAVRTANQ